LPPSHTAVFVYFDEPSVPWTSPEVSPMLPAAQDFARDNSTLLERHDEGRAPKSPQHARHAVLGEERLAMGTNRPESIRAIDDAFSIFRTGRKNAGA